MAFTRGKISSCLQGQTLSEVVQSQVISPVYMYIGSKLSGFNSLYLHVCTYTHIHIIILIFKGYYEFEGKI